MLAEFPTHTVVMIILLAIATAFGAWLTISQTLAINNGSTITRVNLNAARKRTIRWGAALALIGLFAVRWIWAVNPPGDWILSPAFAIGYTFLSILIGVLPLMLSATFRRVILLIPTAWFVGLHVLRIEGGYFLTLLDSKLLPPEFAIPAGYGDIAMAVFSAALAYLLLMRRRGLRPLLIIWNILSFVDFTSAFITGATYIAPFATQRVAAGYGIEYVNYVLIIPTVVVPILAVINIYTLFQLANPSKAITDQL